MFDPSLKPNKVYFEVTNACNFHCDFCPIGVSQRPKQHMPLALYQKGIDEIAAEGITDTVGFHVLGEPLLYPHIYEAICYARQRGLRTELTTNGSLLTEERVQRLIASGLDLLSVSVQVLSAAEHDGRTAALTFEQYYARVMNAVHLIRSSGSPMEVVLCYMDTSSHKYFDVDEAMRKHWDRRLDRQSLAAYLLDVCVAAGKQISLEEVRGRLGRLNLSTPQLVQVDERTQVYVQQFADWGNAFTSRKVYPAHLGFCGYALQNVGVLSNGQVTICCPDYDGKTALGNLQQQSLAQLLSGERAQAIRSGMKRLSLTHPYCQRCFGGANPFKAVMKGLISVYLFKWAAFRPARVQSVVL